MLIEDLFNFLPTQNFLYENEIDSLLTVIFIYPFHKLYIKLDKVYVHFKNQYPVLLISTSPIMTEYQTSLCLLVPFTMKSSCQLNVMRHQGASFGVQSTKIGIS